MLWLDKKERASSLILEAKISGLFEPWRQNNKNILAEIMTLPLDLQNKLAEILNKKSHLYLGFILVDIIQKDGKLLPKFAVKAGTTSQPNHTSRPEAQLLIRYSFPFENLELNYIQVLFLEKIIGTYFDQFDFRMLRNLSIDKKLKSLELAFGSDLPKSGQLPNVRSSIERAIYDILDALDSNLMLQDLETAVIKTLTRQKEVFIKRSESLPMISDFDIIDSLQELIDLLKDPVSTCLTFN